MTSTRSMAALGATVLASMTAIALVLVAVLLAPPANDLVTLAIFLLISGGATVLLGLAGAHLDLPQWLGSLRAKLVLVSVLTAVLAMVNVGFTASLMFLSTHDLALLFGLLTFSLGMSIFVGTALSSSTRRTLDEVVRAVRLFKTGSLDTRVRVRSSDEMGEVALAFNSMAERLEASFERERELEQARKDLIGAVSHDLRTPIASIRAMVESINDGIVTEPETIKRYLETTQKEVENLGELVNDLFDLSTLDAGLLELHIESCSVRELISDTLESMAAQAEAGKLTLGGTVAEGVPPVMMDLRLIQRVLYNLVQNSIRHTPPDGSIYVRARDVGSEVEVEVVDDGEGIPEHEIERLFDRSYRSDPSRKRSSTGTGLGLSIARGIVEAHGGRIWVKSAVGQGTTFSFVLPKV